MLSGRIVLFFAMVFTSVTTWAAPKPFKYSAEMAAKYTAETMNSLGTYEKFMMLVKINVSKEQYDNTWKFLTKNGINKIDKLPNVKQDGKKVYFDKNSYIQFNDDETMTLNGKIFQKSGKPLDVVMQEMMEAIPSEAPSASFSLLIPKAHAVAYVPPTRRVPGAAMGGLAMTAPSRPVGFPNYQPQPNYYPASSFAGFHTFSPYRHRDYSGIGCQGNQYYYTRPPIPGRPIYGPRVDPYGMDYYMGGRSPACNQQSSSNFGGIFGMLLQMILGMGGNNNLMSPDSSGSTIGV